MNALLNAQPDQRSAEWYEGRKGRITASRVGAILGLSKYKTRAEVLREMVREYFDAPREFIGNEATEYGQAHEADALAAYEQRYAVMVEPCGLIPHPLHDFLAASPDGLVGVHGLVECKCPFRSRYTTPSPEYIAQMQLQMECTGRDWCDFVIWREGEPLIIERIEADPNWLQTVMPELEAFCREFADICADDKRAAPYLADAERRDSEWMRAATAYRLAASAADSAKQSMDAAKARLQALAPHGAKGCGVTLSFAERQGSIDYARAVKQMLPDVDFEPFRREGTTVYSVRVEKSE